MDSFFADVILFIHAAWIFFVVIGQLLIFLGIALHWSWIRNFWFRYLHLSMMTLVAVESVFNIECPLTTWERGLRRVAGGWNSQDSNSFIARWLGDVIFYDLDGGEWPFLVGYLAFTALVVWSFWKAPPRMPMTTASFVALVHLFIGVVLLATVWQQHWAIGAFCLVQAALWYGLQKS